MNFALDKDPTSGKYIIRFDASLYKESNCMRRVWYQLIRGLRPLRDGVVSKGNHYAAYGNAGHRALKCLYSGGTLDQALKLALDYYSDIHVPASDWRTSAHLANTVMAYHNYWKQEGDLLRPTVVDGKPLLEHNFAFPFYSTNRVEVLLCGTMDLIGTYGTDGYRIMSDHKFHAPRKCDQFHAERFLDSFVLSTQLMLYKYVFRQLFPGQDIHCQINGIFLSENNKNIFRRSRIFEYSEQQMNAFRVGLNTTVINLVKAFEAILEVEGNIDSYYQDSWFPQNFTCCNAFCPYIPLCSLHDSSDVESIVEATYGTVIYNPLNFQQ